MKIINKKELFESKEGIILSRYSNCCLDGLYKYAGLRGDADYYLVNLLDEIRPVPLFNNNREKEKYERLLDGWSSGDHFDLIDEIEKGKEFVLTYDMADNDGFYDDKDMFAVYDKNDLINLIMFLSSCLKDY